MKTSRRRFERLVIVGAFVALPMAGFAQEATLSGTVADSTGAVLPGVAVTAVHEASGNTFETVTDGRGTYRIPARVGTYRVTVQPRQLRLVRGRRHQRQLRQADVQLKCRVCTAHVAVGIPVGVLSASSPKNP